MTHYVAIIEDAGPDHAVGVWFPDLPGCTSGGDDIDEALRNAPEALELYAESFEADGKPMPRPVIASAVGVSVDTIYKAFGGKPGLVRAIRERALQGDGPEPAEARSDRCV